MMKTDRFYNDFRQVLKESVVLKAALLVVLLVVVGQALALFFLLKNQRVILVPTAKFSKEVVVKGEEVSPQLIRIYVRDAINLITNYTPKDAEERFKEFLYYVSPRYYHQAEIWLASKAKQIKQIGASQYVEVRRIELKGKDTALVEVYYNRFISGELVDQGVKHFLVKYRVENGRFYVELVKELSPEEFQRLLSGSVNSA